MRRRKLLSSAVVLALVVSMVGVAAPAMATLWLKPGIPSGNDVTPQVGSGFTTCADELTSYTWNGTNPGTQTTPEGMSITVSPAGQKLPGKDQYYFDFAVVGGEVSQVVVLTEVFIVGWITESNLYSYTEPAAADTKLHPPTDRRDRPFKIDGIRFCYEPTIDISGRVYEDLNANGVYDSGEPGLGGEIWTVTASNGDYSTSVDPAADGSYSFDDLPSGSYTVCQGSPAGWIQSEPAEDGCYTGVAGSTNDADFGKYQTATISGTVVEDANGDGDLTGDTTGLAGFTVTANGSSDETDADGNYTITEVTPGTYDVCQVGEPDWIQSFPDGCYPDVVVESGDVLTGYDFGDFQPGSISGTRILNGDGFPGQTVRLLDGEGAQLDSAMTDADGFYSFGGLTPGDYSVCTADVDGGTTPDTSTACDSETEVGQDVTVASGQAVEDVDFEDLIEGAVATTCGEASELAGDGASGELLLEGCDGTKVIRFLTNPEGDEAINEVSFDTVGEWFGGGYTLEHWIFDSVPTSTAGDWRLYYNDGAGDLVAPFCLADPRNSPTTVPSGLTPGDYLPGADTTCIIEDNRMVTNSVTAEFWLFSIGDPSRGFR